MLLQYAGTSHFSSAQDNSGFDLLGLLGYRSFGSSALYARGSTAFADSLLSLKYVFDNGAGYPALHFVPSNITAAPHRVYKNPLAFPMAFSVPQAATALQTVKDPNQTDTFAAQNALFAALSGEKQPLFTRAQPIKNHEGVLDIPVTYEWTAEKSGTFYATIGTKDGRIVTLDAQKPLGEYFTGEHYGVIQLGKYQKGETVRLTVTPTAGVMTLANPLFYVQDDAMLARFAAKVNAEKIAFTRTGSTLTAQGNFDDALAFFSVPYNANLMATVDGIQTKIAPIGGVLCAVPVTPGNHTIVLSYQVHQFTLGLSITLASALALAAAFLIFRKKEKITCQF